MVNSNMPEQYTQRIKDLTREVVQLASMYSVFPKNVLWDIAVMSESNAWKNSIQSKISEIKEDKKNV